LGIGDWKLKELVVEKAKGKKNGIKVRNEEKVRDKIGRKKRVSLSGMKMIIIIERERERLSLLPSGLLWHPNKRNLFSFFSRLQQ